MEVQQQSRRVASHTGVLRAPPVHTNMNSETVLDPALNLAKGPGFMVSFACIDFWFDVDERFWENKNTHSMNSGVTRVQVPPSQMN